MAMDQAVRGKPAGPDVSGAEPGEARPQAALKEAPDPARQASSRLALAPPPAKCTCGGRGGPCAACRQKAAEQAAYFTPPNMQGAPLMLQRQATDGAAAPPTPAPAAAVPAASGLIVEDDAPPAPGHMGKSRFLATLREQVTAAADAQLATVGRSTADCPYIGFWFAYYATRSATQIERSLVRYEPAAASARTADDYVPHVVARVRRAVATWAATGEVTGVPEGVGALGGGAADEPAPAPAPVQAKAAPGGIRGTDDPAAIRSELGPGSALDSGVRGRMEGAFGRDFSSVRVHTDANAASVTQRVNARAFTVGEHVALGAGEYRPGTMMGDALLAHELAHVGQQARGGSGSAGYGALERDADEATVHVLAGLWGSSFGVEPLPGTATPVLGAGLGVQRCTGTTCPPGEGWTVTNRVAALVGCDCTWQCAPFSSGQMAWTDPDAPPPRRPGQRHTAGAAAQPTVGGATSCMCLPLHDDDGNIIGRDIPLGAEANFDVSNLAPHTTGRAIGELGGGGGTRAPDPVARDPVAEVRPAEPRTADPPAAPPAVTPRAADPPAAPARPATGPDPAPETPGRPATTPPVTVTPAAPATGPRAVTDLLTPDGAGFRNAELDAAYRAYRGRNPSGLGPEAWARAQTSGRPSEILESELGPGFRRAGGTGGPPPPPLVLTTIARPTGYTDPRLTADLQTLNAAQAQLWARLGPLRASGAPSGEVNAGLFNILTGNIAEILSNSTQARILTEIQQGTGGGTPRPDATIYRGVTVRLMQADGTLSPSRLFSDNVVGRIRGGNLELSAVFEVKAGAGGGAEATSQVFEWIEGRLTDGSVIEVGGQSYRYAPDETGSGRVIGLASARRVLISPTGAEHLGSGSSDQIAPSVQRVALPQSASEIRYLGRRALEGLGGGSGGTP